MGWQGLHAQHDVAECASFLLPRLNWTCTQVNWERRTQLNGELARDCQGSEHLLCLDPPDGLCCSDLQSAVQDWYQQSDIICHAPTNKPHTLLIQLPRFRQHEGGLRKHRIPVHIPRTPIHIPELQSASDDTVKWYRRWGVGTAHAPTRSHAARELLCALLHSLSGFTLSWACRVSLALLSVWGCRNGRLCGAAAGH